MKVRAIAASPDRDGVVGRDISRVGSWVVDAVDFGSERGLPVFGGTETGSGTGIGAGGGRGLVLASLSWATGSDWTGDGFGGITGGWWGSDCSQALLASCSTLLPSGSKSSRTVWSTPTFRTEDANGGVSTGRGGGLSDPGGAVSVSEDAAGGSAATV